MEIRKAQAQDATRINELLYQVAKIHAEGRPDVYKTASKKYGDEELTEIMACESTPIFVAVEKGYVVGYVFCLYKTTENHSLLQDKKTLYIDDLCVDERERGKGVGKALYEYALAFAEEKGFDNVTLNVWAFNEGAYRFYKNCGMKEQRIIMEKSITRG